MRRKLFAILFAAAATTNAPLVAAPQGNPVGFEEEFALAIDRGATLSQLIPGTIDYYFYSCLHLQNTGAFDQVEPLLGEWIQRHGRRPLVEEIENRQALLTFERDPEVTYQHLRQRLGLGFSHQRHIPGQKPDLPTALDQSLLSREVLTRRALARHPKSLDGFTDAALEFLVSSDLDANQSLSLLQRLQRPDYPNLPARIVASLRHRQSRGFGSLALHQNLLLDQLEECVRLRPDLLNEDNFVAIYVKRLRPNPDVDWRRDAAEREAYLERLERFARRLAPAHNSFLAHVLYHRLAHDRTRGVYDRERFLDYLRLPRQTPYMEPKYLRRRGTTPLVNLGQDYPTELGPVHNDEGLVRGYFQHFFRTEDSFAPYADLVRDTYLKRLFAETKILYGLGDPERWYSMLNDPGYYEQLKARVELEFAATQPQYYDAGQDVALDVDVKNVGTLLLKIFEINTFNYLREAGTELDASLSLDGLVANEERSFTYDENPFRRVRRRFELPGLNRAGTFVVELIGNGKSSRTVIRKGRLQMVERVGAAGHALRILAETGRHLTDASVWLAGQEYVADDSGEVLIPFSTQPGQRRLILRHGDRSTLASLDHQAESYALAAGVFVDREALLTRGTADVLIRPTLRVNGWPASIRLLEEPVLTITSTDGAGVSASQEIRGFELFADRESAHQIQVPEGLTELTVTLRGHLRRLSRNERLDLSSAPAIFRLSTIDATAETSSVHLSRTPAGYQLDVLGKNGEPWSDRAVGLQLRHRDFRDTVSITLKTDAGGRIRLGRLDDIVSVQASGYPSQYGVFELRPAARTYASQLRGQAGETLRVPYQGRESAATRRAVSFLEKRGGAFVRDRLDRVAIVDGYVELRELPPGDYSLWLKEANQHIAVSVAVGAPERGWVSGGDRLLPVDPPAPLHITAVELWEEELRVQLGHPGQDARVHVVATRYLPPFELFPRLTTPAARLRDGWFVQHPDTTYHSGRDIGDEYRYILDRRLAARYPGNMLRRPGLLLNPWALEETATALGGAGSAGGRFAQRAAGRGPTDTPAAAPSTSAFGGVAPGVFPNLDFLPESSVLVANLRPDANGVVTVALADLGPGQHVHVLAVDSGSSVYQSAVRAEIPLEPRDRRLRLALDPGRHYAEQKEIELVAGGATTTVEDLATSRVELYDSLGAVYQLFSTLSQDSDLAEFAFLLEWPNFDEEYKRELYSKYACHELHFFLLHKDPAFFATVVRPYLANKMHKTFLDHWLLGADLSDYLEPWAFARLNAVEQILLARRLEGQRDPVARHLQELLDLIPVNPELARLRFNTALSRSALDGGGSLASSVEEFKDELRRQANAPGEAGKRPSAAKAHRAMEEVAELEQLGYLDDEGTVTTDSAGFSTGRKKAEAARDYKELDADRRERQRALYRAPAPTREYAENNYWHRRIEAQLADLVKVNGFWRDYALHRGDGPFLSAHVAECTSSFAEMILALAVLDLPFEAGEHDTQIEDSRLTVKAAHPLLLVRQEIKESAPRPEQAPILTRQNFFRLDDRYRFEGNERFDKFVTDEFLTGVVYGCQVVLTNPTSAPRKLELLLQIPRGALPVQSGFFTRGVDIRLDPFSTTTFEYHFYFPTPGQFGHFPMHVAAAEAVVAFAEPLVMNVVTEPTIIDTTSWAYVSQSGDAEEVLDYLRTHNLHRLDLAQIAWRMRDAEFYRPLLDLLRRRHVYDGTLWSYGLYHRDAAVAREYLRHADGFLQRCGRYLESPLVSIDPVERHSYQHIEYEPLYNPRAHRFGRQRTILNGSLARQYLGLLSILAYLPQLGDEDWLSVTYYLLLQDRVEEALAAFSRVNPAGVSMRLQYDAMQAYLDFFSGDPTLARSIAERYREHPVERWRNRFAEMLLHLDEVAGAGAGTSDPEDRNQQLGNLAASEPALEMTVEARTVTLQHENLQRCEVSYYEMDIEFLFSTSPFVQQGAGSFAYIKPNRTDQAVLSADGVTAFELPAEFHSKNVLVEVRAAGLTRRQAYYANTLTVQMVENYGQLKVTHAETRKPLSRVYVKVFSRGPGGGTRFHKDGYTDLRGRFDYASLSGDLPGVARFAVLVLSEEHGAIIREVDPPLQ